MFLQEWVRFGVNYIASNSSFGRENIPAPAQAAQFFLLVPVVVLFVKFVVEHFPIQNSI